MENEKLLTKKQQYVIGFLFDSLGNVLLINKNRPDWQKGKFNGIGGHVEKGEKPIDAIRREFFEEAGLRLDWVFYCTMVFPDFEVHCYRQKEDVIAHYAESKTDELISWHNPERLPENIIPNLHWLIPMALQMEEYMTCVITNPLAYAAGQADQKEKDRLAIEELRQEIEEEFRQEIGDLKTVIGHNELAIPEAKKEAFERGLKQGAMELMDWFISVCKEPTHESNGNTHGHCVVCWQSKLKELGEG